MVLSSQLFDHCEPLGYGAGYPIFPRRIVVTFILPSHDFLDGIHYSNYTRQPTSALLGFAILTFLGKCVPQNGLSRSKRLLKPRPLPRQYWGLELRTSLTKAGDGAKCGAKFAATLCVIISKASGA